MNRIYRLENEEGIGAYQSYHELTDELFEEHDDGDFRPTMQNDLEEYDYFTGIHERPLDDVFCACDSIKSLMDWFGDFYQELIDLGFEMVEYLVDDWDIFDSISGNQIFFIKENAIKA